MTQLQESKTTHLKTGPSAGRYQLLDTIRGLTLLSMITYHTSWDLVYIFGVNWPWYASRSAFYWQQSICWTFIALSGFCTVLSHHPWKRGLQVFGAGLLVTAVTLLFMPDDRVIYGVLTFIGSAMLITAFLRRLFLDKIPAPAGAVLCFYLFYLFYHINNGYVTFWPWNTQPLPMAWYHGMAATYWGLMEPGFFSTDYFSILPWIFLYLTGYFLGRLVLHSHNQMVDGTEHNEAGEGSRPLTRSAILHWNVPPLSFLGRHSLLIYLLHQPIVFLILTILMG